MIYTSRSAVEAYADCNFYRYNMSFREGKGLSPTSRSVPLVTGGTVHRGVEHLLNRVRIKQEPDVDTAVGLAVEEYIKECEGKGFRGKDIQGDRQQWFTFNEQKALAEGLIRSWHFSELPKLIEQYEILSVEREMEPLELAPNVMFMARVDAEMRDIKTRDYVNYSLKTASMWGDRMEESYKSDLQGITEIWSVEQDSIRANRHIDNAISEIQAYADQLKIAPKSLVDIAAYLTKRKEDKRVGAIRFCFLIKGQWKFENRKEDAIKKTESPLIRGYKNISPGGINYAHSFFFPNPDNDSGFGRLGKGWERFNVWEDMGVKEWFRMISGGGIQEDCGDIVKQQVVTPVEYFRNDGEIKEGMEEVRAQEEKIAYTIKLLGEGEGHKQHLMREIFPKNRKHCFFHFGSKCEYHDLCFKPEISEDPIGSGLYQIRIPHHEAERIGNG